MKWFTFLSFDEIWTVCTVFNVKLNFVISWPRFWQSDLLSCPLMYSYEIWIMNFGINLHIFWWSDLLWLFFYIQLWHFDHVHSFRCFLSNDLNIDLVTNFLVWCFKVRTRYIVQIKKCILVEVWSSDQHLSNSCETHAFTAFTQITVCLQMSALGPMTPLLV
jgi:hypothetical protein